MRDRIDAAGLCWPSQLKQVEQYLRNAFVRLNVQKLSGDAMSIEVDGNATLQDLKHAIARAEKIGQGLHSDILSSLVLGDHVLRDEFDAEGCRWKCLSEYGIEHGSTLGLITHQRCWEGRVTIVVWDMSGGPLVPVVVDADAKLKDLRNSIRESEGLEPACMLKLFYLQADGFTISHEIFDYEGTLSECGIDGGTTIGWKRCQSLACLKENVNPNANVNPYTSNRSPMLKAVPTYFVQPNEEPTIGSYEEQYTPTRSSRVDVDCMSSASKLPRTRSTKPRDTLKRL
jgi:hypothetical protein